MAANRLLCLLVAVVLHGAQAESHLNETLSDMLETELEKDTSLATMTGRLVERYFSDAHCVAVVTQGADYLLGAVTPRAAVYHVTVVGDGDLEELLQEALDARCLAFVVRVADAQALIRLLAEKTRRGVQRANRRYLVLPLGEQAAPSVLRMREMAYMPDLVEATTLPDDGGVQLATHRYVGSTTWQDRVELDVWRHDAWERGAELFPDKLSNLGGRRFVFATFNYPPYAVVDLQRGVQDGMELRIGAEFARKHNIAWQLSVDAENEWGEVYDNFTGNGILGDVVEDKAALGFGALYLWYHEYQHLDFSCPYIRTGITCLAPRPRPLPGWMAPVIPFTASMWAAVGASLVISSVALYGVTRLSRGLLGSGRGPGQRYGSVVDCAFRTLGLLVLQAPDSERHEGREEGPSRHVLAWLLVVFLLVTTSYSSGLASVLAVPRYEPPIDTVADLARSGVPWAATHEAWVFSLRGATEPALRRVYLQFRVLREDTLHRRATAGDLAFSVERLPAGHFAVGDYLDEAAVATLRLMRQDLYWERSTTVARKGSPLVAPLNAVIHRLLDAGLLLVWEGQVARRFLSQRVQVAVLQSNTAPSSHEPAKLTVAHVQGGFILLGLGLALSLFVFGVEIAGRACLRRVGRG